MIVQVGEEIDAIFVDFFGRVDIFVAESREPGVGSDLAHLFAENFSGNERLAREIHLRNGQARTVTDLKLDFYFQAGKPFLPNEGLTFGMACGG